MAIKLISNYAKRLGLPGYSSHQFSVSIETELTDLGQVQGAFVQVQGTDCWGRTDDIGRFELPMPSPSATFVVHAPSAADSAGGFALLSEPFVAPRARGIVPLPQGRGSAIWRDTMKALLPCALVTAWAGIS